MLVVAGTDAPPFLFIKVKPYGGVSHLARHDGTYCNGTNLCRPKGTTCLLMLSETRWDRTISGEVVSWVFLKLGGGVVGRKKDFAVTLTRIASLHVRQTRVKKEGVVHRGRKSARGDVHSLATPSLPQFSVFDSSLVLLWPGRASCRDGMFDIFLMIRSELILCSDWLMDVRCSP